MLSFEVSWLVAFLAGVVSFLSPCVLPLVPGYIALVSGLSSQQLAEAGTARRSWRGPVLFVLGFSLVFTALGAFASGLVSPLAAYLPVLRRVAGVIVVLFGLHMMGLLPLRFLYRQRSFEPKLARAGFVGPLLVGMAFAFGWTPCVGPILASVLALAATEHGVLRGMGLLFVYSLGIGVPFLLTGFGVTWLLKLRRRSGRFMRGVEIAAGVLLIVVGVLIFGNDLVKLAALFPGLDRFAR